MGGTKVGTGKDWVNKWMVWIELNLYRNLVQGTLITCNKSRLRKWTDKIEEINYWR